MITPINRREVEEEGELKIEMNIKIKTIIKRKTQKSKATG